jgi:hypothetical protein
MSVFALSVSNPSQIISFLRKSGYLDKILFCHLIQYCKYKPSTIIAKAQKVSASTTGSRLNLEIQDPKGA